MNTLSHEKRWLHIGLILLISVLSLGVLKVLVPTLFLKKVSGTVKEIQQKYSGEGNKKLIIISFAEGTTLRHSYVNKDYLPSPQINKLREQTQLVAYTTKGEGDLFYGLELTNGEVIQSRRWDLLAAYLNHSLVVFVLIVVPLGLYWIYGKELLRQKWDWIGFVTYTILLSYIWGKLHIFLMLLLVLGLIQLGKRLSKQKEEQVTKDIDLPAQT